MIQAYSEEAQVIFHLSHKTKCRLCQKRLKGNIAAPKFKALNNPEFGAYVTT